MWTQEILSADFWLRQRRRTMNSHSTRTHETSLNDKKKIIPCPWKITRIHVPHNYWYWFKMTRRPNKTTDNDKTKHGSLLKLLVCWLPVCQLSRTYSLEKYPRSVFLSFSPLVLFPWSIMWITLIFKLIGQCFHMKWARLTVIWYFAKQILSMIRRQSCTYIYM